MPRKKVDSRVRTLIENGVKMRHRTMFVIVGDKGRDQVVNLHYILAKASVRARPSVLWCYQQELGFVTHRGKRMNKIKKDIRRGLRTADEENPFELFLAATDIRYAYYKESHRILGNTYGMCILQDFSALTPNLLARTIETVEGGGIIVLLLKTMTSLKQLCAMTMDVHARFRTESHQDIVPRFNERFMLSLGSCSCCLVVDDELNILPISSHVRNIQKINLAENQVDAKTDSLVTENQTELNELKVAMKDTQPVGKLIDICRTLDQARAVLTCVEAISEKTLRSTVVTTAARGRGKSAALGISIAGAVAYGYSNIFVTAPSPENVKTLFDMILKGFDALEYKEHQDYEVVQSTNPDFNKAVVRINIFQEHRQTIQYIQPSDYALLAQAELVVIDEAAAIPLPVVKSLMGNYLCFLSSTVNGYEGTGRSLSLKLVKELRQKSAVATDTSQYATLGANNKDAADVKAQSAGGRVLREIVLEEPIRYGSGDPVEKWLSDVLCLDCTKNVTRLNGGVPHPSECELYMVERDTLFSYHRASEAFLHRMMSLFVSSHYKNTPNDLQMLSDAPAHYLFVLLGPVKPDTQEMPDILVAIQVALEGQISKESVQKSMARGRREAGDLIPWTISEQFQNDDFALLSGARVVRIAAHPDLGRMGYASRAMELLSQFYEGKIVRLTDGPAPTAKAKNTPASTAAAETKTSVLLDEVVAPRLDLPPLLQTLTDVSPPDLQYLGVSYGITQHLYNFWKKCGFLPVYLRQTPNELTGEHTTIVIKVHRISL
jgi:N-acetyltransferase 10